MEFTFSLIAPYKNVSAFEISSVSFRTPEGAIQIFKNHAPMIAELTAETVIVKLPNGAARTFKVTNGLVSVDGKGVEIFATEYSEE